MGEEEVGEEEEEREEEEVVGEEEEVGEEDLFQTQIHHLHQLRDDGIQVMDEYVARTGLTEVDQGSTSMSQDP